MRQTPKRTERNRAARSAFRSSIKKAKLALGAGDVEAAGRQVQATLKLIGKTESGFSYAAVGAATAPAGLDGSNRLSHFSAGVDGRYLIGRAQKDILAGNSSVGLLVTHSSRQAGSTATALGKSCSPHRRGNGAA